MTRYFPTRPLNRAAAFLAGIALLSMALLGAVDVVSGRFFRAPVPGALELTETLMVCSVFFAVALAQEHKRHIRVELLINLFPRRARAAADVLAYLATLGVFALIAWYGWHMALYSYGAGEYQSGLLNFPLWPARLSLALGASLMVLQSGRDTIEAAMRVVAGEDASDGDGADDSERDSPWTR